MPRLVNSSTGTVIITRMEIAKTFWSRFLGLQFRNSLAMNAGLLLCPCCSLHTCFMRFPIDVIMLDGNNNVLAIRRNIQPWRTVICVRQTKSIVETPVGAVDVAVGTTLRIEIDSA